MRLTIPFIISLLSTAAGSTLAFAESQPPAGDTADKAAAFPASASTPDRAGPFAPPSAPVITALDSAGDTGLSSGEDEPQIVEFSADQLDYDTDNEVVVAEGNVSMQREGNNVRADRIEWDRKTGRVIASGDVAITGAEGDKAYGDRVELTDTLKDGVIDNILLVIERGGRIAARSGSRTDGRTVLDHAVYSPCDVAEANGCPKTPLWRIKAVEVIYNPAKNRIYYRDARMEVLGMPLIWLPRLSHPDGSAVSGTGLLVPDIRISRLNGLELAFPYYFALGPNHDLTLTPHVYTKVLPALEGQYRRMTDYGPFQIGAIGTVSSRLPVTSNDPDSERRGLRGYLNANGQFQFTPEWRTTFSGRLTSDSTFMRRYDVSRDDRLRSFAKAERIGSESYFSVAGWAVQTLRATDVQGQQPFALPAIDYRWRPYDEILGGRLEVQANSVALIRTAGQDTRRALASVKWDMRRYAPGGQVVTLTGFARGDVYQTDQTARTANPLYRGSEGWHTRGIAAVAADFSWPLAGAAFGGVQTLTPRVQFVASPNTSNLSIPNEDARAVDLEDSNLFALNRFPGYDRWEDGSRVTWGVDWSLNIPDVAIESVVGQSYRLTDKPSLFPDGTGLTHRFSDVVGRTTFRWRDFVSLTLRYRLDKNNLAIRRNEVNAMVGSRETYVTAGYLKLKRNINLEDLGDREEIRLGARWKFARYWSVFGSTIIDLTSSKEAPLTTADGFEPIRHRIGLAYEDECFEFGITWRRDYVSTGDARRANTYLFRISLKNLGR